MTHLKNDLKRHKWSSKLFRAWTVMDYVDLEEIRFHNVLVHLFKSEVDRNSYSKNEYEKLIRGYIAPKNGMRSYAEDYILESFSKAEIEEIEVYLKGLPIRFQFDYREVSLPVPENTLCLSALPIGKLEANFDFFRYPNYSLSFKLCGYLNLRECKCTDLREFGKQKC